MNLRVQIENFKSIKSTELELRTGLNILVGPNGSGKTCIFSSLKFLRDYLLHGVARALAYAGGPFQTYHRGTSELRFTLNLDYGERIYRRRTAPCTLMWTFSVSQQGPENSAIINDEQLRILTEYDGKTVVLFSIRVHLLSSGNFRVGHYLCPPQHFGRNLFSVWDDLYSHSDKKKIQNKFKSRLTNITKAVRKDRDRSLLEHCFRLDNTIDDFFTKLRSMNEYNILPAVARIASEPLAYANMKPNGEGVSEVVHALEKGLYSKLEPPEENLFEEDSSYRRYGLRPRFFYFLRPHFYRRRIRRRPYRDIRLALKEVTQELAAGIRPIDGVSTRIDQTNGKRFVVFHSDSEIFLPEEVSDGTIKWLCILISIYVPHSQVYLIEEPENFLHPWMQQRLVEMMRGQAVESDTIYLMTSHSTTIVNAAQPDEILLITLDSGGTNVARIPDRENIEEVLIQSDFGLGDLWVSGAISGIPSHEE